MYGYKCIHLYLCTYAYVYICTPFARCEDPIVDQIFIDIVLNIFTETTKTTHKKKRGLEIREGGKKGGREGREGERGSRPFRLSLLPCPGLQSSLLSPERT